MDKIGSLEEALMIAREFAAERNLNVGRAEAFCEVWFDAGKDERTESRNDLRAHLQRRFADS